MDFGGRISPRGARTGTQINTYQLQDVTLTNPVNGQVLTYLTGGWVNSNTLVSLTLTGNLTSDTVTSSLVDTPSLFVDTLGASTGANIELTAGFYRGGTSVSSTDTTSRTILGKDGGNYLWITRDSGIPCHLHRPGSTGTAIQFYSSGGQCGSIGVTASATSFNTSSDYRLKTNIQPMADSTTRLMQLKPVNFTWIKDPDFGVIDGFLAHEVQTVVPEAIVGEKDAVDESNEPVYQGIDQSKLVPLLVAALQDALREIEGLKSRVSDLENP